MVGFEHVHAEFRSRALAEMKEAVEVVAVADDDEVRGNAAQQRYGGTYHRDYRQLLERSDVDFVFIHSANNRHKRMVLDTVAPAPGDVIATSGGRTSRTVTVAAEEVAVLFAASRAIALKVWLPGAAVVESQLTE